jgi:hypothetical protein
MEATRRVVIDDLDQSRSVSGGVRISAWSGDKTGNSGGIRRETGLKPLNGFRLKGVLIYRPLPILFESGKREIRNLLRKTRPFLLS